MFKTVNVANTGKRGRPPMPREHSLIHNKLLNSRGGELGEVRMEAGTDGGVVLTAIVNGRKKMISFPPVATPVKRTKATPKATQKTAPKATAARRSAAKVTKGRKTAKRAKGVEVFA